MNKFRFKANCYYSILDHDNNLHIMKITSLGDSKTIFGKIYSEYSTAGEMFRKDIKYVAKLPDSVGPTLDLIQYEMNKAVSKGEFCD